MMGKRIFSAILCGSILITLFSGCGKQTASEAAISSAATLETTEATVPATVPPDGNPNDVTCKGSYSADSIDSAAVVASIGESTLTNGQLQAYYWLEAESYRQAGRTPAPDFDAPLDTQPCEIDQSVASWQQYFLKRALNTWHASQALELERAEVGIPTEEAYQPNLDNHKKYLTDIPATEYLYGYNSHRINTLHQQYLDDIPAMLDTLAKEKGFADASSMAKDIAGISGEDLSACVELYNRGYMYYTALSYYLTPTDEEVDGWFTEHEDAYAGAGITKSSGKTVDIRHILLIPQAGEESGETVTVAEDGTVTCSEELWQESEASAQALVEQYEKNLAENSRKDNKSTEDAIFAELANKNSMDAGSALDGGLYQGLREGQLTSVLDAWCFDGERQYGDVAILRSAAGVHVMFFKGSRDIWYDAAEADLTAHMGAEKIAEAKEAYPAEINYSAIALGTPARSASVTASDLLYPDVGHQRYPEAQLYLQQDYPTTMYGSYPIRTHGCGITTMSMLATYLSDTELTPPTMCARYGGYCYEHGTDGSLFSVAPSEMGFYLKKRTFEWQEARDAMREGYPVVCVQTKGFWTRGGHYLLLEKMFDDDKIQVRDSNIFNYGRLEGHKIDLFDFSTVVPSGLSYWIYDKKIVTIPACERCGEAGSTPAVMFAEDGYLCEKCDAALLRRNTYLTFSGGEETVLSLQA